MPDPRSPFAGLVDTSGTPIPPATAAPAEPSASTAGPVFMPTPALDLYGRALSTGDAVTLAPSGRPAVFQLVDCVPSFNPKDAAGTMLLTFQQIVYIPITPQARMVSCVRVLTGPEAVTLEEGR